MALRTKHGLLVARGLLTALVFQGLNFPQCVGLADRVDPDGYPFGRKTPVLTELDAKYRDLFMSRTEAFKMNWCEANQDRCPEGEFPSKGPEAVVVRRYSAMFDALPPPSVRQHSAEYAALNRSSVRQHSAKYYALPSSSRGLSTKNDWFRPTTMGTLRAAIQGDNDRCCQTQKSMELMFGWKQAYRSNSWCFITAYYNTYQTVSTGSCYLTGAGSCINGQCRQITRVVKLLCWDLSQLRFVFRWFDVNNYCSCQVHGR